MKLTLRELQRAQPALQKMLNADLPIKAAFRLSRIAKEVADVFDDYEKQRTALVQKYGATTSEGNFTVKPENIPIFTKELNQLLDEEDVDISAKPLKEDELVSLEGVKLSAIDLVNLGPFFLSEEPEVKAKE